MRSTTFFWVLLGLIGAIVLYLVLSDEGSSTFGMANSRFAEVALLSMWLVVVASAVLPRKGRLRDMARNAVIWLLIILVLAGGYIFRYDLQDIASRMTAGLVPGSPRSVQSLDGGERVVLSRSGNNHFQARVVMNDATVTLLVDTGASSTVLTERDAAAVDIDVQNLNFSVPSQTANGVAWFARARVESLKLGPIERQDIPVLVGRNEVLGQSLLGMNFLNSLSSFEFRGEELFLTD